MKITGDDIRELISSGVIKRKALKPREVVHNPNKLRDLEIARNRNHKKQIRQNRELLLKAQAELRKQTDALHEERLKRAAELGPQDLTKKFPDLFQKHDEDLLDRIRAQVERH